MLLRTLGFLATWLCLGFVLGTALLLGPVRWVTDLGRQQGWPAPLERGLVLLAIALLVVGSALLARATVRRVEGGDGLVRIALPLALLAVAILTVWAWFQPALIQRTVGSQDVVASGDFVFGPYPDDGDLRRLHREGFTVVSLLHPAVVPFEPQLLERERAAAERVGIPFLHAPMLPWVSENEASLRLIEELALGGGGPYYVHCYLGKDRVQVVRRLVERSGVSVADRGARRPSGLGDEKWLRKGLERGAIVPLDDVGFLTPYMTDGEFFQFVAGGDVGTVVSLLDPGRPSNVPWIDKEEALCRQYKVDCLHLPLSMDPYDPWRAVEIAERVRELERPVVVHDFLGVDTGRALSAEAFLSAFRTGRPPLAPGRLDTPLAGGEIMVVAPHVVIGPEPRPRELERNHLRAGVRHLVWVGPAKHPGQADGAGFAAATEGVTFEKWSGDDVEDLVALLGEGGPYYLYGPGAEALAEPLREALASSPPSPRPF